jgi:H+-translocating NAD(P) transhydrogenase subunit beta
MSEAESIFHNAIIVESVYMLSSIFFVLSLGGLSSQESSKRGNLFGIYGMTLALIATLFTEANSQITLIAFFAAMIVGGLIGIRLAVTVQMNEMPELVACLHSFVGIAATVVGYGSFFSGENFDDAAHDIELFIGIFIGVITFIGSVVAWGKFNGKIQSEPLIIGGWFRHVLNAVAVLTSIYLCYLYVSGPSLLYLIIMTIIALFLGWHLVFIFEIYEF